MNVIQQAIKLLTEYSKNDIYEYREDCFYDGIGYMGHFKIEVIKNREVLYREYFVSNEPITEEMKEKCLQKLTFNVVLNGIGKIVHT